MSNQSATEYDISTYDKAQLAWLWHRDKCFVDNCKVCDRILKALWDLRV